MYNPEKTRPAAAISVLFILLACVAGTARSGEGGDPSPIPYTHGLDYYLSIVNSALPAFTPSLLSVPPGPDWMAGKSVHDVAMAMQDTDPGTIVSNGPRVMGFDPPDGPRCIKLDFSVGYIRYMNRNRSFHIGSPCVAIPETDASTILSATAGALGIPTSEWDVRTVDKVMERSVDGEAQDPTETTCETERMVTMGRRAPNGYPVFDSKVRESVSNLHERARLLVEWPKFAVQTGLVMRTRTDVVTDLAQRILQAESDHSGLGTDVDLEIRIGYAWTTAGHVPVAKIVFADIYDRYEGLVLDVPLAMNPSSDVSPQDAPLAVQLNVRFDPAGSAASLEFYLPAPEAVRLSVLDVAGRVVASPAAGTFSAGWHQATWDLRDGSGRRVPPGMYFARLEAGREKPARKILVIR